MYIYIIIWIRYIMGWFRIFDPSTVLSWKLEQYSIDTNKMIYLKRTYTPFYQNTHDITWFCDIWEEMCIYIKLPFHKKSIIFGMKGTNKFRLQKNNVAWSCCSYVRLESNRSSPYPIASALEVRLMNGWYLIGNVQKTPWIPSWLLEISRLWRNESNMHNVFQDPGHIFAVMLVGFNGNLPNGLVSNPIQLGLFHP